jgi:phage FluMu protein Com
MEQKHLKDFRCRKCHQLQCKYRLDGNFVIIEIKCYACNEMNELIINLSSLLNSIQNEKD